ncbi:MAG: VOC family protein [Bauldia sp.]|nr:MAG: VOC family protein [Bauldia sp.]
MTTVHGAFHWNELMTRDVGQAKDFYAKTLGWTYEDMPMAGDGMTGTYTIVRSNGAMVGGMMQMEGPMFEGVPDHWFTHLAVDDVDARVAKLKAAGGKVVREPWDIPGIGRIAIVEIPGGAVQGWMTPAPGSM